MDNLGRTKILGVKETTLSTHAKNYQYDFYHLFALRSGTGFFYFGSQRIYLTGGQCLLVHPYVRHENLEVLVGPLSSYEIFFEVHDSYLDEQLHQMNPVFELTPFIETALAYIIAHWNHIDGRAQVNADNMLSAMMLPVFANTDDKEIVSSFVDISSYNQNVKKIIHYVEKNFSAPFRLDQLAILFNLSSPYMCTLFKRQTGHSIVEYLNYVRLRNCINAFYCSRGRILEIALSAGFSNASHFNRVFRKYLGTTPTIFCRAFSIDGSLTPNLYEKNVGSKIAPTMDNAFEVMRLLGASAREKIQVDLHD